jgi:hypothetical protein
MKLKNMFKKKLKKGEPPNFKAMDKKQLQKLAGGSGLTELIVTSGMSSVKINEVSQIRISSVSK